MKTILKPIASIASTLLFTFLISGQVYAVQISDIEISDILVGGYSDDWSACYSAVSSDTT